MVRRPLAAVTVRRRRQPVNVGTLRQRSSMIAPASSQGSAEGADALAASLGDGSMSALLGQTRMTRYSARWKGVSTGESSLFKTVLLTRWLRRYIMAGCRLPNLLWAWRGRRVC